MLAQPSPADAAISLPDLPILRARVTFRLLEDALLPGYKGALLRGGFGYAFQRISCPQPCWGRADSCTVAALCPYRHIFETPRPPGVEQLHDLQDVPRPFVIEPPLDDQRAYRAGQSLEFGLVVIGRGIDFLPFFLLSFERLGHMGLGARNTPARLEQVEVLRPWQPVGDLVYQQGRAVTAAHNLPLTTAAEIVARAKALPPDLRLSLLSPLRVKAGGAFIEQLDLPAIVRAISWRLHTLSLFHGAGPWDYDYRPLVAQAAQVVVERAEIRMVPLERTSRRGGAHAMQLDGIVGSALLRDVPLALRTMLVLGELIHVGKAAVFGHGRIECG